MLSEYHLSTLSKYRRADHAYRSWNSSINFSDGSPNHCEFNKMPSYSHDTRAQSRYLRQAPGSSDPLGISSLYLEILDSALRRQKSPLWYHWDLPWLAWEFHMILSPKYRSSDYCHKRELMTRFYLHQFRWVWLLFDHLTACEIYHHLALGIPQFQSLRTICHGSLLHCWQICASLLQKIWILVELGLAVSSNDSDFTKERPD